MSKDSSKTSVGLKKNHWPWLAIPFAVIVFFGSQIISSIVLSIYPLLMDWSGTRAVDWLNNSIVAQFLFMVLAESMVVGAAYWFVKRYINFKEIGLRRPKWTDLLSGLIGLPAYLVLYFFAVNIVQYFYPTLNTNQKQQIGFNGAHGGLEIVLTFISLVILPPIAEEILFRGLIYSSLKKLVPLLWAVIGTSLLFALGHLPEGGSAGPLYIAGIDTFCLSLVLIYLREKTGGLYASMTLHALKNFIAFVALFALHLT